MGSIGRLVLEWCTRQMVTHDMTPNMAYNPTLAFYTQPSGLESKYAYILE